MVDNIDSRLTNQNPQTMKLNFLMIFATALVPLAIGFIYYNPKVFGNAWMKAAGLSEEQLKGGNMPLIFGLTYFFGLLLTMSLHSVVIHQMGVYSLLMSDPKTAAANSELYNSIMAVHQYSFRTYKHGALHGAIAAIFMFLPVVGINALFERRGWKYIALHTGYWTICLTVMGAIICHFG